VLIFLQRQMFRTSDDRKPFWAKNRRYLRCVLDHMDRIPYNPDHPGKTDAAAYSWYIFSKKQLALPAFDMLDIPRATRRAETKWLLNTPKKAAA
jgi:hypothetical protein